MRYKINVYTAGLGYTVDQSIYTFIVVKLASGLHDSQGHTVYKNT